jgi:CheY-like chemotaxis protein/predicted Zn-dependent protease
MALWNLKSKTVLIVDDFAQMRTMLSAMLKIFEPKEVIQAANGKEAIEMMAKHRFDIVLCDYNLGEGQDGQQILEEAKYLKLIPYYTLFIMVTAENTNSMVMGAAEHMPDAYLSKPINKTVLISRLQKLLAKKEVLHPLSDALENGDAEKIIQRCDVLLKKDIKFKFEVLKTKCEQLLKVEKYDEAMEICTNILNERDIPWAMMIIGQIHLLKNNYYDAEMQFRDVIDIAKSFMPGYDWLAKVLSMNESYDDAQEVLADAIVISPKSILRQRNLAEIAEKNDDFERAEKAREKVIEVGRTSCMKLPADYTKMAKVYLNRNKASKALKVLGETEKTFRNDDKALIESTVELALVHKAMDNQLKYKGTVDTALKLASQKKSLLHGEIAVDLARSCMDLGKKDEAQEILTSVVKEFYENEDMMKMINEVYEDFDMASEGTTLISETKNKVIKLNNEGVNLIKDGKINEAIKLFQIAVREMPEHITININVAKSLLLNMKEHGANPRTQRQINEYLSVVFKNDPNNEKALEIQSQCRELSK